VRKSGEERQAEIVQSALDLAAEKGLSNVTTQDIAGRVGIAQPTIFRHFPNRDAIFRATMEFVAGGLFKALEGLFSADMPADERLRRMLERQFAFISKRRGVPRLLFSDRLHLEDPELKATVRRIMERYQERVARILAEGKESGCFRADLDENEAAKMIAATFQGVVMRWSLYDFNFPIEEEAERLWRYIHAALVRMDEEEKR